MKNQNVKLDYSRFCSLIEEAVEDRSIAGIILSALSEYKKGHLNSLYLADVLERCADKFRELV